LKIKDAHCDFPFGLSGDAVLLRSAGARLRTAGLSAGAPGIGDASLRVRQLIYRIGFATSDFGLIPGTASGMSSPDRSDGPTAEDMCLRPATLAGQQESLGRDSSV